MLLVGCSKTDTSESIEIPNERVDRELFVSMYIDSLNYNTGVYNFGNEVISYAFPYEWDMSIIEDTLYLTEATGDISYEIEAISIDEYKDMVNNENIVNHTFSLGKNLFGSEFRDSVNKTQISTVQTSSSSDYFSSLQCLNSTVTFNNTEYELPYFIFSRIDGDNVLVVKLTYDFIEDFPLGKALSSYDDMMRTYDNCNNEMKNKVDRWFVGVQDKSDKLKSKANDFFRYLYYGSITMEEQDKCLLNSIGVFPYYKESKITLDELNLLNKSNTINSVILRYDDFELSALGLDKFADVALNDDVISWNPNDGVHNDSAYTLTIMDSYAYDSYSDATIYSWAHKFLYNTNGVAINIDDVTLNGLLQIVNEEINTYSYSDSLSNAEMKYIVCTYGDCSFRLPIIFYNIYVGDYILQLKAFLISEDLCLTNYDREEFLDYNVELNDDQLRLIDTFEEKFDDVEEYSKGLLRLLYNGNILLIKEIGDEEKSY